MIVLSKSKRSSTSRMFCAEADDVVPEVRGKLRRVGKQLLEVVARRVVEGETAGDAKLPVQVLEPTLTQLCLPREHLLLGRREHAVEPAKHGERQDDILVLAAFEAVPDEVRDAPEEAHDFAVVHRWTRLDATSDVGFSATMPRGLSRLVPLHSGFDRLGKRK